MKRTLLYDKRTGEIRHTHHGVYVGDGRAPGQTEKEILELASRHVDVRRVATAVTSAAPQSSRRVLRMVDPKTGRMRTRRIPDGYWTRRDQEEHD